MGGDFCLSESKTEVLQRMFESVQETFSELE
jgi:hypothetical protein